MYGVPCSLPNMLHLSGVCVCVCVYHASLCHEILSTTTVVSVTMLPFISHCV